MRIFMASNECLSILSMYNFYKTIKTRKVFNFVGETILLNIKRAVIELAVTMIK